MKRAQQILEFARIIWCDGGNIMKTLLTTLALLLPLTMGFRDGDFDPDITGISVEEKIDHVRNQDLAKSILPVLREHRPKAVEIIHKNLGLADPIQVRVMLHNIIPNEETAAVTIPDPAGGTPREIIYFLVDILAQKKYTMDEIRDVLTHELIHAAIANKHTFESYGKFPEWMMEGIAVYGANQLEKRARLIRFEAAEKKTPEQLVNGLKDKGMSMYDYPEAALAIEYIKVKYGVGKVKALTVGLCTPGKDYKELIHDVTGEDFDGFQKHAREFALAYLKKLSPSVKPDKK